MDDTSVELRDITPGSNLSIEDLEKKYFGDKQSYYTSNEQNTDFNNFQLSESDFDTMRSQVGEDANQIQNITHTSDEGLIRDDEGANLSQPSRRQVEDRQMQILTKKILEKRQRIEIVHKCLIAIAGVSAIVNFLGLVEGYGFLMSFFSIIWQCMLIKKFVTSTNNQFIENCSSIITVNACLLLLPAVGSISSCLVTGYYCTSSSAANSGMYMSEASTWMNVLECFALYYINYLAKQLV